MPWTHLPNSVSSAAPAAVSSPPAGSSDGEPSATSSASPTASACSSSGSPTATSTTPPSGTTPRPSTGDPGLDSWMSSLRASRASRSVRSASDAGTRTSETAGLRWPRPFATFYPESSSWRTFQLSLLTGRSVECLGSWPDSGMTRGGVAYRLEPLAPRTIADACGCWPTPAATDWKGSSRPGQRRGQLSEALETMPAWIRCECCEDYLCTIHLRHAYECPCEEVSEWSTDPYSDPAPGRTAPRFCEWLMGWPIEWTASGPLATGRFHRWLLLHGGC